MNLVSVCRVASRLALLLIVGAALSAIGGCEEDDAKVKQAVSPPVHPSGIPDISFNGTGWVTLGNATTGTNLHDVAYDLALDGSGRIVVAGVRSQTGGVDPGDMAVWRFTANGTLDTGFGTGGVTTYDFGTTELDAANALTIDTTGRIVVGGYITNGGEQAEFTVWRLGANGAFDTTFNTTGRRTFVNLGAANRPDIALGIAMDGAGNILAPGVATATGPLPQAALIGLRSIDGANNPLFNSGNPLILSSSLYQDFSDVIVDSSGRIVTAGWETCGPTQCLTLRRYSSAGVPDTTFNATGTMQVPQNGTAPAPNEDFRFRMREDAAGNLVVVNTMQIAGASDNAWIWRVTTGGVLDTTFGGTGYVQLGGPPATVQRARDLAFDALGNIVVVGEAELPAVPTLAMTVWRLLPNGQLDNTFGLGPPLSQGYVQYVGAAGGAGNDGGYAIRVLADGRILVAGYSTSTTGGKDLAIWRLQ